MKRLFVFALLFALALPASVSAASLTYGSTGSAVTALQNALISKGYLASGYATGRFGPLTLAAVKKFQCDMGIICSGSAAVGYGVYGPRTQAALALSTGSGQAGGTGGSTASFEIMGWLPYWREASSTLDALQHIDQLTEVNPFIYIVQNDGTINDMVGIVDEPWASLRAAAKAKKVRFIPTVMWSNTAAIHEHLSNTTKRIALEDAIADLAMREGFDGIDINFEGKMAEDKAYFSTFLKGLYQRMGTKWVMCTIESRTPIADRYTDTVPPDATLYANDFVEINKYCDRIRFMTYDQQTIDQRRGAQADAAGQLYAPVADVVWVEKAIREAMKTIPKSKIILGIATYGYIWEVTAYANAYTYDLQGSFGPGYAPPIAAQYGQVPARQFSGEIGFTYSESGGLHGAAALADATARNTNHTFRYLTWQDAEAIKQKVDLAKRLGLRGVALFRLDGGEDPNIWSFLTQVK